MDHEHDRWKELSAAVVPVVVFYGRKKLGSILMGLLGRVLGIVFWPKIENKEAKDKNMDLIQGPIGTVGDYEIDFVGGKLVAKAKANASGVDMKYEMAIDSSAIIDLIAAKIPGSIDDAILAVLKEALKKL